MRDERGVTLILTAMLIVVLLGAVALAVDIGRLYLTRQYLVNGCDASALAGGMELPNQAKATAKADETANANGMANHKVSFPADGIAAEGATKIRVDGQLYVHHTFARILGFGVRPVGAYAVVLRRGHIGSVTDHVVPWGIPWYDTSGGPYTYNDGVLYSLKMGTQSTLAAGQLDPGGANFFPLALERSLGDGSSGGSVYSKDIKWGFPGTVAVGDIVSTEPGNMVGPTRQAVSTDADSLIKRALQPPWNDDTWNNYDYGCPRIVVVPIVSPMGNGRTDVEILGFASFFVQSFSSQEVTGYFIGYSIPQAGGSGPDFGVFTFRLIE